jgi:hypothetical protein
MITICKYWRVFFLLLSWLFKSTTIAETIQVLNGESIQAAIDGASPGDVIVVQAGIYNTETSSNGSLYGLRVSSDNLTLIGENGAVRVIQGQQQQETGLYVAPPNCDYTDQECSSPNNLLGFSVSGFSVENFPANGIQTRWVEGFTIHNCSSINNLNNGLYATLSRNGVISNSFSSGSLDSALWVAGSTNVTVIQNELTLAPTGLEITVSNNVYCTQNNIHDNTVGVGLYHANMAGNPPQGEMKDWIIENNTIYDNNFENAAPPGTFQAALLPGIGVFLVGVSHHAIQNNLILNHTTTGIAVLGYCTATSLSPGLPDCNQVPPITLDASANYNQILNNTLMENGSNPPDFLPSGDILYIQTSPLDDLYPEIGDSNCFQNNLDPDIFTFYSSDPSGELPTGGCADNDGNDESAAPSPSPLPSSTTSSSIPSGLLSTELPSAAMSTAAPSSSFEMMPTTTSSSSSAASQHQHYWNFFVVICFLTWFLPLVVVSYY